MATWKNVVVLVHNHFSNIRLTQVPLKEDKHRYVQADTNWIGRAKDKGIGNVERSDMSIKNIRGNTEKIVTPTKKKSNQINCPDPLRTKHVTRIMCLKGKKNIYEGGLHSNSKRGWGLIGNDHFGVHVLVSKPYWGRCHCIAVL